MIKGATWYISIYKQDFKEFEIKKEANFYRMFIPKDKFDAIGERLRMSLHFLQQSDIPLTILNRESKREAVFNKVDISTTRYDPNTTEMVLQTDDRTIDLIITK